jgi:hypothetical protein
VIQGIDLPPQRIERAAPRIRRCRPGGHRGRLCSTTQNNATLPRGFEYARVCVHEDLVILCDQVSGIS